MEKESNKMLNQETTTKEVIESPSSSKTTTIKINPEYSKIVNSLSNAEYESLKNSIKEDGLHYPIVINSKGEILDGHHRYKICKELDIALIKLKLNLLTIQLKKKDLL